MRPLATASPAAANRRFARRWFDQIWNKRRPQAIDAMLSPACIAHGYGADGGDARGPEAFKTFHQAFLGAFPDLRVDVEDIITEGRKIAVRWVASGTHQGEGLGFAATGRPVRLSGMTIMVLKGGVVVEGWDAYDQRVMFQQLGVA